MKSPDFRSAIIAYIREQARPVDKFIHHLRPLRRGGVAIQSLAQAEQQLRSANAQVGVAKADFFPQLSRS